MGARVGFAAEEMGPAVNCSSLAFGSDDERLQRLESTSVGVERVEKTLAGMLVTFAGCCGATSFGRGRKAPHARVGRSTCEENKQTDVW